ncbi:MAG: DUF1836 domain-containing protein [Eggerthellaceae bacterium]|nr:DUF1836 domain-containing protein [Eggerthellaceae bacterium]
MTYDATLVAAKLRRWEKYLKNYTLPSWQEIPDFGLYMEQVIVLMNQYLDYLPPELKDDAGITAATINNYVRKKVMPEPRKKRYYRIHLAYLIIICTLKQSLPIALVQRLLPADLTEAETEAAYTAFVRRHRDSCAYYIREVRASADGILHPAPGAQVSSERVVDLIVGSAVTSGFARLLADKLLALDDVAMADVPADELARDGSASPADGSAAKEQE